MSTTDTEQAEMARALIQTAQIVIHLITTPGIKILATAQVTFGGTLEVNGFTIIESHFDDQEYTVNPPSYGKKYAKAFFMKDPTLWKEIKEKIIRYYKNLLEEEASNNAVEEIGF